MTIDEYLDLFSEKISREDYLRLEKERKSKSLSISGAQWLEIIQNQDFRCYYCNTNIEIIQELIFRRIIKPRKRGTGGYSGMHFELDHKNADKKDNNPENLVASCYYCNNDKSNTIDSDIFRAFFGKYKGMSFDQLFKSFDMNIQGKLRHHYNFRTL